MTKQETEILIVGAGPTGLMAANVLARHGVDFRIIDKEAGPAEESRALWVQPRTVEYWAKVGLAELAITEGKAVAEIQPLVEGEKTGLVPFGGIGEDRTPYPFALILEQSKSERLLLGGLGNAGARVEWETELIGLNQAEGGVTAVLRRADGSEETVRAGWVIGADGSRSLIRESLGLKFQGKRYERGHQHGAIARRAVRRDRRQERPLFPVAQLAGRRGDAWHQLDRLGGVERDEAATVRPAEVALEADQVAVDRRRRQSDDRLQVGPVGGERRRRHLRRVEGARLLAAVAP